MAWREIIYQYDGSFDGLLCCVFESYTQKERPMGTTSLRFLKFAPLRLTALTHSASTAASIKGVWRPVRSCAARSSPV